MCSSDEVPFTLGSGDRLWSLTFAASPLRPAPQGLEGVEGGQARGMASNKMEVEVSKTYGLASYGPETVEEPSWVPRNAFEGKSSSSSSSPPPLLPIAPLPPVPSSPAPSPPVSSPFPSVPPPARAVLDLDVGVHPHGPVRQRQPVSRLPQSVSHSMPLPLVSLGYSRTSVARGRGASGAHGSDALPRCRRHLGMPCTSRRRRETCPVPRSPRVSEPSPFLASCKQTVPKQS